MQLTHLRRRVGEPSWLAAWLAVVLVAGLMVRSWELALGVALSAAGLALLALLNPSLSRLAFWAFLAVLVTAIPAGNLRPPGMPGMFMAYRLLLGLFVGFLIVDVVLNERRVRGSPLSGPLALWLPIVAWAMASLLWGRDLAAGLRYCVFLAVGVFLMYAIRRYALQPGRLRAMLLVSAAAAVIAIAYGVFESRTGIHLPESATRELPARYGWMVTSVFHNTNEFATYIALWLPVFAAFLIGGRSLRQRIFCAGVLAMGAYCMLGTGSRANILALGIAVMTLVSLSAVRWPLKIAPILAIALLLGLYGLHRFETLASKHQLGALEMSTVLAEGSRSRGQLVADGLTVLSGTFGAGVGAGNVEGYMADLGHRIQNVHNWWLEILVNLGLVSFALYVWFYVSVAVGLYASYHRAGDRGLRLTALGLLAGWVGFAVGCLSSSSLVAWAPMWIYFGLCVGTIEAVRAEGRDRTGADTTDLPPLSESR